MVSLTAEGQAALILGSIILALDVLAVLLRVCARRSKNVCLGADDYWILFALPLEFAYVGLLFWGRYTIRLSESVFNDLCLRRHWWRRGSWYYGVDHR